MKIRSLRYNTQPDCRHLQPLLMYLITLKKIFA